MKKTISWSYLRYLLVGAYAAARTYASAKGHSIYHYTPGEFTWVVQSVWLAALPQLRHATPTFVNYYLKKKYPALGITLKDLEFSASQPEVKASI